MNFAQSVRTIGEVLVWLTVTNDLLFLVAILLLPLVHVPHVPHV